MRVALGVDFGTESARALLVDLDSREECGSAEASYRHGVIDEVLPSSGARLPHEWALQDADDYLDALERSVRDVFDGSAASPDDVVSLGIDTTACTVVPCTSDLVPLSRLASFRENPYAYAKLWKDHSSQYCADDLNGLLRDTPGYLEYYGGSLSPEWMLPKTLMIYREAPSVFESTELFLEQEDWIVSNLVGKVVRGAHVAGYKGGYREESIGYPPAKLLDKASSGFSAVLNKLGHDFKSPGQLAGLLVEKWADRLKLPRELPVAVGNMDAHVAVLGAGVVEPNVIVAVMGTSVCDLLVSDKLAAVKGIQGVVRNGILPKMWAYEAGQAGVGDTYAWFVKKLMRNSECDPQRTVGEIFRSLEEEAEDIPAAQTGIIALDWLNGNRSRLIDTQLSGVIVGLTVSTQPAEIYRALLESTALGQRVIFDAFQEYGIEIKRIVACGGLAKKSPLLMQILADVTGREIEATSSSNTPALGAALHGAIAGAAVESWEEAADVAKRQVTTYRPIESNQKAYDSLYQVYMQLHDFFGVEKPEIMHSLRATRSVSGNNYMNWREK